MLALLVTWAGVESAIAASTPKKTQITATKTSTVKKASTPKKTQVTATKTRAIQKTSASKKARGTATKISATQKTSPKVATTTRAPTKSKKALASVKPRTPTKKALAGAKAKRSSAVAAKASPRDTPRIASYSRGGKGKSRVAAPRTPRVAPSPPSRMEDLQAIARVPGSPDPWERLDPRRLALNSESALVIDQSGKPLYSKSPDRTLPIASITKLMTAMVVLDSGAPLNQMISVDGEDRELLGHNGSRLKRAGAVLSREEMLRLALMSSENIAAAALGRTTFPGGMPAFVAAMNRKAQTLGMRRTQFADPTGLDPNNRSCAQDLILMVRAARRYPLIHEATTTESMDVYPFPSHQSLHYVNTNRLVRGGSWDIQLSKTGFLNVAGRCLVMTATLYDRTLDIVLLNSPGRFTHFGDSNRLRQWIAAEMRRG